jgi:hypothetical protein
MSLWWAESPPPASAGPSLLSPQFRSLATLGSGVVFDAVHGHPVHEVLQLAVGRVQVIAMAVLWAVERPWPTRDVMTSSRAGRAGQVRARR